MSLLNTPEVTPSRILSLYRLLLAAGEPLSPDILGARAWPHATRKTEGSQQPFDRINLHEMREARLIEEMTDGSLQPHPNLPETVRCKDVETAKNHLPLALADLIFHGDERNHDLAYALAWYLLQDPLRVPGGKDDLPNTAKDQGVGDLTGLINDFRFGTFRDWSCYLGFAWQHDGGEGTRLQADPTAHLRARLPIMLPQTGHAESVGVVVQRLAKTSPVFEGGRFRERVETETGLRTPPDRLSASTSFALFRLQAEGLLSFEARSDSASRLLACGSHQQRVTHLARTA